MNNQSTIKEPTIKAPDTSAPSMMNYSPALVDDPGRAAPKTTTALSGSASKSSDASSRATNSLSTQPRATDSLNAVAANALSAPAIHRHTASTRWRLWRLRFWSLMLMALTVLASCDDSAPDPEPKEPNTLVDATLVASVSSTQIQLVAQLSGLDIDVSRFVNDVEIYKVTYNTTYRGNDLVASGLISLPKTTEAAPMLSYQHGTITRNADAPSSFSLAKPEALVAGAFSSSGFVTVIPDYIGFGSTADILHPYYVGDALARSVVDMLQAAIELAEQKNVTLDEKLFLAGYSEGGYATMATHKQLEASGIEGLDLVASFPGAGAFDLQDMQDRLFAAETYEHPYYLAYLTLAYQHAYGFDNVLTDFFQEPYASVIPSLFDNEKGSREINSQLTTSIADLIQPDLRAGLHTEARYKYLQDAFTENSLTDWTPTKRMYMYHGTSDTTVPFDNSQHTYDALIANGASPDVVTFTALPGDHTTAVTPYVADLLLKVWSLK